MVVVMVAVNDTGAATAAAVAPTAAAVAPTIAPTVAATAAAVATVVYDTMATTTAAVATVVNDTVATAVAATTAAIAPAPAAVAATVDDRMTTTPAAAAATTVAPAEVGGFTAYHQCQQQYRTEHRVYLLEQNYLDARPHGSCESQGQSQQKQRRRRVPVQPPPAGRGVEGPAGTTTSVGGSRGSRGFYPSKVVNRDIRKLCAESQSPISADMQS